MAAHAELASVGDAGWDLDIEGAAGAGLGLDAQRDDLAAQHVHEVDRDLAFDVVAALAHGSATACTTTTAAAAEGVDDAAAAEELREEVVEGGAARVAGAAKHALVEGHAAATTRASTSTAAAAGRVLVGPGALDVEALGQAHVAEFVVVLALVGVAEDLVGGRDVLELVLGGLVARVLVRVMLLGELAKGSLDLGSIGGLRDAECGVEVLHGGTVLARRAA